MAGSDVEKSPPEAGNISPENPRTDGLIDGNCSSQDQLDKQTLTDWDGPDDPGKPWNWSLASRLYGVAIPTWYAFAVTFGTSVYSAGFTDVEAKFHVSRTVAILGLSLYSVGLATGPIIGAPLSENLGRKGVYLISMPIALLFTMAVGLANNIGTVLVCRFLSAFAGAPALAVGAGSAADLFDMQGGGGIASAIFISMSFFGSAFGPLVGGYTFEAHPDYAWTMWVLMIVAGSAWLASFFVSETSKKIILKKRALERGMAIPPRPPPMQALKTLLTVTLFRPLNMLIFEPIVGWTSLYIAFVFGILFAFFEAFPYVFDTVYHFSLGQIGLTYLGIIVGVFSGTLIFTIIDKTLYAKAKARVTIPGKTPPPEERLYACMIGSFLLPISFFWFAWTARPSVHWISPVLAGCPFGCGLMLLMQGVTCYLIDAYQAMNAASALAANGLLRYGFGAAFPLFAIQMFEGMGVEWAVSLLGFVSLALLPIPWVLYKWGPVLRQRSSYKPSDFN